MCWRSSRRRTNDEQQLILAAQDLHIPLYNQTVLLTTVAGDSGGVLPLLDVSRLTFLDRYPKLIPLRHCTVDKSTTGVTVVSITVDETAERFTEGDVEIDSLLVALGGFFQNETALFQCTTKSGIAPSKFCSITSKITAHPVKDAPTPETGTSTLSPDNEMTDLLKCNSDFFTLKKTVEELLSADAEKRKKAENFLQESLKCPGISSIFNA
ncbi:hypothetical protein T4E_10780 [Trichinella pseudospiralis]|uniref:Uncharacterized protein n=1 Tax=Trichinella pseudospiralis TaxID=6337 RepID=A0A0V0XHU5_TRIPS|nr:hypothetical protein T4E_10780 [Trichinella pseudospiralis]